MEYGSAEWREWLESQDPERLAVKAAEKPQPLRAMASPRQAQDIGSFDVKKRYVPKLAPEPFRNPVRHSFHVRVLYLSVALLIFIVALVLQLMEGGKLQWFN
jgi:hypothetical protein